MTDRQIPPEVEAAMDPEPDECRCGYWNRETIAALRAALLAWVEREVTDSVKAAVARERARGDA